jgi:hypothetical protein
LRDDAAERQRAINVEARVVLFDCQVLSGSG